MPSITFHPVVFSNHLKQDGTINVKIRLTFKRKDRKLPTTINVTKADLTRAGKIKNQSVLDKLDAEVRRLRSLCEDLNAFALEEMDVDDVLAHIRKKSLQAEAFHLDFCQWWESQAQGFKKNTKRLYLSALHSFQEFIGTESVDISVITSALLRNYQAWLEDRHGKDARAVSQYISCLAHIFRLARLKYNCEELERQPIRNPLEYYTPPKQPASKVGHRNTSPEVLRMMVEQRRSLEGAERLGVDLFLISFALMGCNIPDLYDMKPAEGGVLSYNRQKTRDRRSDKALCLVRIEDCAADILKEYADPMGNRQFSFYHSFCKYEWLRNAGNNGLKKFCERNSLAPITLYSARHTWATLAYSAGVPSHIITDGLAHKDASRTMDNIYINKDWSLVWAANSKVLALVFP